MFSLQNKFQLFNNKRCHYLSEHNLAIFSDNVIVLSDQHVQTVILQHKQLIINMPVNSYMVLINIIASSDQCDCETMIR